MDDIGKIDKAELYIVKLPLVSPFITGAGSLDHRESLLLKLSSGEVNGWGECTAFREPWYHYETIETALHISTSILLPCLLNTLRLTPEKIQELYQWVKGHNMAKALIENAVLDLYAKKQNVPLFNILGGKRKRIRSGISLGITKDIDTLIGHIESAVNKKYHKVKVKIRKGWDLNTISAVRSSFPSLNLTVDANGGYTEDDLATLRMLDKFDLKMIEQPYGVDFFLEHASLQRQINTPLCLDESITGIKTAENAVDLKSCRIVCIKQGRIGGLLNAIKIRDYCMNNRVLVWCGGMLETGIGRAFNLHLQTVSGFEFPGDISETSRYFKEDIIREEFVLDRDGYIELPQGDGIGVKVDEERIEKYMTFRKKMVGSE